MNATTQDVAEPRDEEPSPDAMDRLWAALDAALDPPAATKTADTVRKRPGIYQCQRCGFRWDPRDPAAPPPKCCASPACRSAYWDRPAKTKRGRRPEDTDWDEVRRRMARAARDRKRTRKAARVKALAAELGLDVTDPRTGEAVHRVRKDARVLRDPAPLIEYVSATPPEVVILPESFGQRARTVPPPPGLEDLDSTKGTT